MLIGSIYDFRKAEMLNYSVYESLPLQRDFDSQSRYKIFYEKTYNEFETSALFVDENGDYKEKTEIYNASTDVKKVLPLKYVRQYYGRTWIPAVQPAQRIEFFFNQFNIETYTMENFLIELSKEPCFFDDLFQENANNVWIDEVCETAKRYATELKISDMFKIDIFTHNLRTKSGAILHKLVFIYKLAYIKALSKKVGYPMPIFCDSPNGREVEHSTILEMLSIIKRDFSEHQLLIATIFDYIDIFPDANIITLNGKLFNQDNLFDFIKNE